MGLVAGCARGGADYKGRANSIKHALPAASRPVNDRQFRPRDPATCRRQMVADRSRRPDRGHGAGRRRHAADRVRIVDRGVEARHRHAAAAQRGAMGAGLRGLQDHPAISRTQRRHEPLRVQDHLLVGMEPPAARTRDRRGLPAAVPVLPVARRVERRIKAAAVADLRPRRAAGRGRLVDGRIRPVAADRGVPVSAGGAPDAGIGDLRRHRLDAAALDRRDRTPLRRRG